MATGKAHTPGHFIRLFDFKLSTGLTSRHEFRVGLGDWQFSTVTIGSVEGTLLGDNPPVDRRALQVSNLRIERSGRSQLEIPLDLITPHDSVLESRVKRIEFLLDNIFTSDGAPKKISKQYEALRRLGWKPNSTVDNRCLNAPIVFGGQELGCLSIASEFSDSLQTPVRFRITIQGMCMLPS